jgi:hypothetical protein
MTENNINSPQERDHLPFRRLLLVYVSALIVAGAATWWSWHLYRRHEHPPASSASFPAHTTALEQSLIDSDRAAEHIRERQRQSLDTYGWVDRSRGLARIPISEAMTIYARQEGR